MEITLPTIFNILSTFPGNLVYFLILVYSITACLLSVWTAFRVNELPLPGQTLVGLSVLLFASLLPLIYAAIPNPEAFFMPESYALLERTSLTLLMIWSAWLWLGPNSSRLVTIAAITFSIVIPTVTSMVTFFYPENPAVYNATLADLTWHFLMILTVIFFSVLILRNRPSIWTYGIGMMALMLAGFIVSLALVVPEGSISGAARLGILCAFPLLPLLARRYDLVESIPQRISSFDNIMDRAATHAVPDEINAWLAAVANLDIIRQQEAIARMLCQTLEAQGCAFFQLGDKPGLIRVTAGYDLARQTWMEPRELDADEFPKTLNSLITAELSIIRNSNENLLELSRYSDQLKLEGISSVALLPLKNNAAPWGSAVLLRTTPFPSFLMESLQQFTQTAAALSHIFRNNETAIRERQDLIRLSEELDSLQATNQTLQANLDSLRLSAVQIMPEQNTLQMLTLQQASESEIDRLRHENKLLLQTLADETNKPQPVQQVDGGRLAGDLFAAKAEVNRLQNLLQDTRHRLKEIQKRSTISTASIDGLRKFNNLITEIRHPLSTITGYVDLLISGENSPEAQEASQTSMENLQASLEKLRLIMNELTDLNVLNSGVIDLEPELMDLGNAIDQSISSVSTSFMEKEISLILEMPGLLPNVLTYHDALKKVITYLLQNAGKVTPRGGSVTLHVEVDEESQEPYLLIEVIDHGGGIAPEDMPKVFTPAENLQGKVIPGLSELNGGLAASKTLVEAHGGRIWVDSDPGISTTFSVLLPVHSDRNT
jgi:signal transduction histidine kinase